MQVSRQRRTQGDGGNVCRFCVNWNGMLEPLALPKDATVGQLISSLKSAKYAKDSHKLLVFKGLLLHPSMSVAEGKLRASASKST